MMDMTVRYSSAVTDPPWLSNALAEVPLDVQQLRVDCRHNLQQVFRELQRHHGGVRYVPAGVPATVWQCDANNDYWGKYSPWIYTETANRSMKATVEGPVVGWFQGAIDPRVEVPEPIYHPEDKDFGVSQTEAVLFFRVRFVVSADRKSQVWKFLDHRGKPLRAVVKKEPKAVVTVGCTL